MYQYVNDVSYTIPTSNIEKTKSLKVYRIPTNYLKTLKTRLFLIKTFLLLFKEKFCFF